MSTNFTSYIIQIVLDWHVSRCDQERSKCIYECCIVGTLCFWQFGFWMWQSLPLLTFCHFCLHVNCGSQFLVWKYLLSLIWHLNVNRIFLWYAGNWTPAPVPHVPIFWIITFIVRACAFRTLVSQHWSLRIIYVFLSLPFQLFPCVIFINIRLILTPHVLMAVNIKTALITCHITQHPIT
jgi:hypothetical protein